MRQNEYYSNVDIAEATECIDIAGDSIGELLDFFDSELQHDNTHVSVDAEEMLRKLRYIQKQINTAYDDLPDSHSGASNIDEWKDIVLQVLPSGASMKMADDVEDALDQFKSVY